MSMGTLDQIAYSMNVCMDCNVSDSYREGQQAGRIASTIVASAEQVTGAFVAAAGAAGVAPTAGGGAACAIATGGLCAIPAGVALAIEGGMVAAGAGQAAYGTGIIAFAKNNPINDGEISKPKTLQTGGNTLNNKTLKELGLSKEQGKAAIEGLKEEFGYRNDFHGKIMSDGTVIDPKSGEQLGNLYDYVP